MLFRKHGSRDGAFPVAGLFAIENPRHKNQCRGYPSACGASGIRADPGLWRLGLVGEPSGLPSAPSQIGRCRIKNLSLREFAGATMQTSGPASLKPQSLKPTDSVLMAAVPAVATDVEALRLQRDPSVFGPTLERQWFVVFRFRLQLEDSGICHRAQGMPASLGYRSPLPSTP